MPWTAACSGFRTRLGRARSTRRAHRALARELASYATSADRDELATLFDERGGTGDEAAVILAGQAHVAMLRDSDPPLWPGHGPQGPTP